MHDSDDTGPAVAGTPDRLRITAAQFEYGVAISGIGNDDSHKARAYYISGMSFGTA